MAVVNGKVWPSHDVKPGMYRFRVYNGSSSRFWNLHLRPVLPAWQIGTDTGFMATPAPIDYLVLAPGERADILVDFSKQLPGDLVKLRNAKLPRGTESPAEPRIADIMRFRVVAGATPSFTVPSVIPVPAPPTLNNGVPRRVVLLTEIMDADGDPVMALLNARPWETTDIERPTVDSLECWEIVNLTADTHPIHLHLIQFRLANRQPIDVAGYMQDVFGTTELSPDDVGTVSGAFPSPTAYLAGARVAPAPSEQGWKDTIQAQPGMVTRILVPFGPNAAAGVPFGQSMAANPFTGTYVWHCHILDHEDNEMMLPYEVVPAT
jgi:FtsP/CotA-like multicopper oxidase with cupredoxin domain